MRQSQGSVPRPTSEQHGSERQIHDKGWCAERKQDRSERQEDCPNEAERDRKGFQSEKGGESNGLHWSSWEGWGEGSSFAACSEPRGRSYASTATINSTARVSQV